MQEQSIEGLLKKLKSTLEKKEAPKKKEDIEPIFEVKNEVAIVKNDDNVKILMSKIMEKELHNIFDKDKSLLQDALFNYFSSQGKDYFSRIIFSFIEDPKMQELVKKEIRLRIKEITQ